MTDALINYETVKYFTAETYETGKFREAVAAYQKAERRMVLSLNALNTIQAAIVFLG